MRGIVGLLGKDPAYSAPSIRKKPTELLSLPTPMCPSIAYYQRHTSPTHKNLTSTPPSPPTRDMRSDAVNEHVPIAHLLVISLTLNTLLQT